jgi:gluconolactonase
VTTVSALDYRTGMRGMRNAALVILSLTAIVLPIEAQSQDAVQRLDPALDNIIAAGTKLERLADTPGMGTREGPVWVREGGYLLYSDRSGGANAGKGHAESADLVKWDPRDGKTTVLLANSQSDGVTLDPGGRVVIAVNIGQGRIERVERDGRRTVLASQYGGRSLFAPNDLVYKSDGALYFSDPAGYPRAEHPDDIPGLYLLKAGQLTLLSPTPAANIVSPNGLAFAPDEKHLYLTDNPKLMKFEVLRDGTLANGQVFIDMNNGTPLASYFPDGMKVDELGNVYATGPGGIWIMSPVGKHIGTILEPHRPANLAFGGQDGKALFITSRPGLFRIQLRVRGIRP